MDFTTRIIKVPKFPSSIIFCTRFLGEKVCYHPREHLVSGLFLENGHRKVQNLSGRDTTVVDKEKEISFMAAPDISQIKATDKN